MQPNIWNKSSVLAYCVYFLSSNVRVVEEFGRSKESHVLREKKKNNRKTDRLHSYQKVQKRIYSIIQYTIPHILLLLKQNRHVHNLTFQLLNYCRIYNYFVVLIGPDKSCKNKWCRLISAPMALNYIFHHIFTLEKRGDWQSRGPSVSLSMIIIIKS